MTNGIRLFIDKCSPLIDLITNIDPTIYVSIDVIKSRNELMHIYPHTVLEFQLPYLCSLVLSKCRSDQFEHNLHYAPWSFHLVRDLLSVMNCGWCLTVLRMTRLY